jgi:isopenicillin N synthase-like dioxygenase
MWRIGPRPAVTAFAQLNAEPVLPAAIADWRDVMDAWGASLLAAAVSVAELAALGAGLPRDAFSRKMQCGAHLLAPTGSDFAKFGAEGTVLAGYHYDLNFLTVHGKSRFPGLYVWTREGRRLSVAIPDGCLLVQAAKQFEHLTAGHVLAGFHEVVVSPATVASIEAARSAGRSHWRVSSTLFSHIASDETLEPVGSFAGRPGASEYPPILCGHHVEAELAAINLGAGSDGASPAM